MAKKTTTTAPNIVPRHPVVVVMGHIDHGKSTLLDHIRKSNVVDSEAGGITQHLSAYVVPHKTKEGEEKRITFLDTPGHAAFQKMRLRGADVADVAILVVSAEEGVKPQTMEALASIKAADIPFVVAINKIDKPGANIDRTKSSLIENEIYIEGMGGDIAWAPISAKTGEGVDDLLDLVLLTADLAGLTGDLNAPARGTIIESELDPKRGTSATLIVEDGTLKSGQFVVAGRAFAPVRIMENFLGAPIREASLSEPVRIVGFSAVPKVGEAFSVVASKREAEAAIAAIGSAVVESAATQSNLPLVPLLIKADTLGSVEAIEHEIGKLGSDRISVRIIDTGVGAITQNDIQSISATENAIALAFNVPVERPARELAERLSVEVAEFDIIYKLAEWLEGALITRTPKVETDVLTGAAKVLKVFSTQKNVAVLGGKVVDGILKVGEEVKIIRREMDIGRGRIKNLQQQKADVASVESGEFGMQLDTRTELTPGDIIEAFDTVIS